MKQPLDTSDSKLELVSQPKQNQQAGKSHTRVRLQRPLDCKLSPGTLDTIKATYPLLQEFGEDIGLCFREVLLKKHPETWASFIRSPDNQPKAIANTLTALAKFIEQEGGLDLRRAEANAAHLFTRLHPEDYPALQDALLSSLTDLFGGTLSTMAVNAWGEVFVCLRNRQLAKDPTCTRKPA
ncbi:MAG: hypothetical protein ACWA5X_11565 [bacterium]